MMMMMMIVIGVLLLAFGSNVETGLAEFQVEVRAFRFLCGSENVVRCVRLHKCRNINLPADNFAVLSGHARRMPSRFGITNFGKDFSLK
jgi:hypothetical protein